jgi:glycosyltransferase involved in cell wall biosynthesis
MQKLTVTIITLNEEHNIRRCLESVKAVADEIIVVDSFSTDDTEKICLEFGVKFIKQTFLGYIEQKNFAFGFATGDFILSMDADEALSPELQQSIIKAKDQSNADVYTMSRMTSYCGQWIRHGAWYPDIKLRLFKNGMAESKGVNPHDTIMSAGKVKSAHLKGDILHYTYYNLTEHIRQTDNFTSILAQNLYEKGKRTNMLRIIAKPGFRFFRDYILKAGFLDGYYGFVIAKISAYAVFLKEIRLKEYTDRNA